MLVAIALCFIDFPTANADITETRTFTTSSSDIELCMVDQATYALAHDALSAPPSGWLVIGQSSYDNEYDVYRSFVYFDTSAIPNGALITSATLSLYVETDISGTDFNVTVQNGQPTYPHLPYENGDYYYGWYSGNGGSRSTSELTSVGYWNISLSATGLTWIQKDGTTKLCLRSQNDIDNLIVGTNEAIRVANQEWKGDAYAVKLYVTYMTEPYTYNIYGPYKDSGGVFNGVVNCTFYQNYADSFSFLLDGTDAEADFVSYELAQAALMMKWNISATSNETRVYYFSGQQTETVNVYVPDPDNPIYLYTFTVTDMRGVSNGYLEVLVYTGGEYQIIARGKIDALNPIPFYLTFAQLYYLRIVCDQGTLSLGSWTGLTEQNTNLLIPFDAFPISYAGLNVTCIARRFNSTFIQMNYSDWASATIWVHTAITHKQGVNTITDLSDNASSLPFRVDWNNANSETDYLVKVTAYRLGETKTYTFSCPHIPSEKNPWGVLDVLDDGTFPIQPRYLVGFGLVVIMTLIFSYAHIVAGAISTVAFTAFFTYYGWLDVPWIFISVAGAIVVLIAIAEFKKTEREI